MSARYHTAYHPDDVLKSSEFKILEKGVEPTRDPSRNLAAAYAPGAQLHLIEKPVPQAREGEVVLHVRATGICGRCVCAFLTFSAETSERLTSALVSHSDCHFWKVSSDL